MLDFLDIIFNSLNLFSNGGKQDISNDSSRKKRNFALKDFSFAFFLLHFVYLLEY